MSKNYNNIDHMYNYSLMRDSGLRKSTRDRLLVHTQRSYNTEDLQQLTNILKNRIVDNKSMNVLEKYRKKKALCGDFQTAIENDTNHVVIFMLIFRKSLIYPSINKSLVKCVQKNDTINTLLLLRNGADIRYKNYLSVRASLLFDKYIILKYLMYQCDIDDVKKVNEITSKIGLTLLTIKNTSKSQ